MIARMRPLFGIVLPPKFCEGLHQFNVERGSKLFKVFTNRDQTTFNQN